MSNPMHKHSDTYNCIHLKCYMMHLLLKQERHIHNFITADSNKTRHPIAWVQGTRVHVQHC